MKFTSAALFTILASCDAFQPSVVKPGLPKKNTALFQSTEAQQERSATKKEDRLRMMKSPQFYRKGFKEVREQVESDMEQQFQAPIVKELKDNNYLIDRDGVKVHLAKVSYRCQCGAKAFLASDTAGVSLRYNIQLGLWILLGGRAIDCLGLRSGSPFPGSQAPYHQRTDSQP